MFDSSEFQVDQLQLVLDVSKIPQLWQQEEEEEQQQQEDDSEEEQEQEG